MARVAHRFQLPPQRERYGVAMAVAVALHAAALALLLVEPFDESEYRLGIGVPGMAPGGGGGGAGGTPEIRYVDLVAAAPAPASPRVEQREPEVVVPVPTVVAPRVEMPKPMAAIEPTTLALPVAPPGSQATAPGDPGPGAGGLGPGTGGGIGSGQGRGVGSGRGDGAGGEGGDVLAPEPRASPFPFDRPPADADGVEFTVRFYVDERGRVQRVTIAPEIADRGYRRKVIAVFESWTFYPARTLDGRPVKGQYVIRFTP